MRGRRRIPLYAIFAATTVTHWIKALTEGVKPFDWLLLIVELLVLLVIVWELVLTLRDRHADSKETKRRLKAIGENANTLLDATLRERLRDEVINDRRPSDPVATALYGKSSIGIVDRDYTGWKYSDENWKALKKWAKS